MDSNLIENVKDSITNLFYDITDSRAAKISIAIILAVIVAAGTWYYISSKPEETMSAKAPESEKPAISKLAEDYIIMAGNFGVVSSKITADNITDISYITSLEKTNEDARDYIKSRLTVYPKVRDSYIAHNSPLYYDNKLISSWNYGGEIADLKTFETTGIKVDVDLTVLDEEGKPLEVTQDNKDNAWQNGYVKATVEFSSKETRRTTSSTDSTWDGTWKVEERHFPNRTIDLLISRKNSAWKIWNQDGLEYEFLLVTWKDPSSTAFDNISEPYTELSPLIPSKPFNITEISYKGKDFLDKLEIAQEVAKIREEERQIYATTNHLGKGLTLEKMLEDSSGWVDVDNITTPKFEPNLEPKPEITTS